MRRFPDYDPAGRKETWADAGVREFRVADVEACAALMAAREGLPRDRAVEVVARWPETPRRRVLVAEREGRVEGFGKVDWLDPDAHGGDAPSGWYLSGVVVADHARRHGLGTRLTVERIQLLRTTAAEVWYFVNMRNKASIALHERLGFRLHTRDFRIPGVSFVGGAGALYRLSLAEPEP